MKKATFSLLLAASLFAQAAPVAPGVRSEIDALLAKLQSSGCSFQRNGTWHDAAEARSHLLRKLQYLEERGAVQTTEQFIGLAAAGSSVSGKPYLVKCGTAVPLESKAWLSAELKALRSSARPIRSR